MLYYWHTQPFKDWKLKVRIEDVMTRYPSYGRPRLSQELGVSQSRIYRVMKLYGIKAFRRRGRRYRRTADLSGTYPNLLWKVFPDRPGKIWVSDFTHVTFQGKQIYLATVMDIFHREIVGYSLLARHHLELVLNALSAALSSHDLPEILHSDQGSEYTSRPYISFLESARIRVSFSHKASPWENGYQESFYSQFKVDLGDPNRFNDLGELAEAIFQTIHTYNTSRIHTRLKMAPKAYLQMYLEHENNRNQSSL
jgi:putative transposase